MFYLAAVSVLRVCFQMLSTYTSCGHVEIEESFRSIMGPDFPEPFALISITAFIPALATNDPFMLFPVCFRT